MNLFCWTQRKIFWRKFVTRLFWGTIDFHGRKQNIMEVNCAPELLCFPHSSEYIPLCSAEQRHLYRFGTTWGWVNDDRIYIFGWTFNILMIFAIKEKSIILTHIDNDVWLNNCSSFFLQSKLGYITLLLCTAHTFLYGWDRFLKPTSYRWGMPPAYMLSLVVPCVVLILKLILITPCVDRNVTRIRQGWERQGKTSTNGRDTKTNHPLIA